MRRDGALPHEVRLIPTPVGWGLFCETCKYRAGPWTKKPEAGAAAEHHRLTGERRRR